MLKILFAGLLWEGGIRCNDFSIIGQCFALQQKFTLARKLKVILLYQPFQTRTIPRKSPTPLPCFAPSPLPPLSKVRCCRPKKFGRLPEELPHQPSPRTNPSKNRTIPLAFRRGASLLLPLHRILPFPQQLQKDNNPSKIANTLASLVTKGGGLTARHKLLLCCVLIATHPPFLSPNLSAVKTEGLSH